MPTPQVTSISPSSGVAGTTVTITGLNFDPTPANNYVYFGMNNAMDIGNSSYQATVTSATTTQLVVTAPTAITGYVAVKQNQTGPAISTSLFTYPMAIITGVSPNKGLPGINVTITGSNFQYGPLTAYMGTTNTPMTIVSSTSTQIVATIPNGPDAHDTQSITVTNAYGVNYTASSNTTFSYPAPTIVSFPATAQAGDRIRIVCTNLQYSQLPLTPKCYFGNILMGDYTSWDSAFGTFIDAVVPTGIPKGGCQIKLINNYGSVVSTQWFQYGSPTVTSWSPKTGPDGTAIIITGTNLQYVNSATVGGVATNASNTADGKTASVNVWEVLTGSVVLYSSSQVYPPYAGYQLTLSGTYTVPPPVITSFSPTSGPAGTVVTINGTNLIGGGACTYDPLHCNGDVYFNGILVPKTGGQFITYTNTQYQVVVPAGNTSGPISLRNYLGTAYSSTNFNPSATTTYTAQTTLNAGNSVTTYYSTDGTNWISFSSVTLQSTQAVAFKGNFTAASGTYYAGIDTCVTSAQKSTKSAAMTVTTTLTAPGSNASCQVTFWSDFNGYL